MRISSRITALKYKCLYNSLLYINRNNAETKRYQEEGLKLLSRKVDSLPSKIAFRPKFIKQSSCIKVFDKLYLFISKANIKKPLEERFDALFHEIGHWLHFQNIPPLKECREIWKTANLEKIKEDVSEYAVKKDDGREFVAEVFKGLIKGKKYDEYIMNLYKRLHGPVPHD
ncbi:TPA: hypothetical protein CPT92_09665 [Candidatus Gastranaerophilales bacterium HUM_13]|jgi:hypothetical protein|nr:hypothetical protein [bacterium]DAB05085.1 MAG TPA: hypothetical protein CPT92_09665 [Candidatus Gastranaerophilales bacterium HUM_13]